MSECLKLLAIYRAIASLLDLNPGIKAKSDCPFGFMTSAIELIYSDGEVMASMMCFFSQGLLSQL